MVYAALSFGKVEDEFNRISEDMVDTSNGLVCKRTQQDNHLHDWMISTTIRNCIGDLQHYDN